MTDIETKAIELLRKEKNAWYTGSAFVTEKVSFEMREVVKRARKNYYGIFDEPKDRNTGLDKIWVPLTEWTVENYVKNTDLDTKDINIKATKPEAVNTSTVVRQILRNFLDKVGFGELLDDGNRQMTIDGTWIQKSFKGFDPKLQKTSLKTTKVDFLNFFIDPAAKSIQAAFSVIEISLLTPSEVDNYKDSWINTKDIKYTKGLSNLNNIQAELNAQIPANDFYERWGQMPKYLITGKEKDLDIYIEGHIVASGLEGKQPLVHKIETNTSGKKPYEEAWLKRVPNRWAGRGIPEQLFGLQAYVNEVVNTRRNNNLVLQNRLYQIRKGSGITPQKLAKLVAGGGIEVSAIDQDIREMATSDTRASSYKDEEVIYDMASKQTGAYPISAGEQLPASTPATNAVIQNTNARSSYTLVQEGLGMFLKRLVEHQWLPIIFDVLDDEELINILGESGEMQAFDEMLVEEKVVKWMWDTLMTTAFLPEQQEIEQIRESLKGELKKMGKNRFSSFRKKGVDIADYEIDVYVTNEDFDKAVLVNNLTTMLTAYSQITGGALDVDMVVKEALDILGVDGERFFKKDNQLQGMPNQMPQMPQMPQQAMPMSRQAQNITLQNNAPAV